MYGFGKKNSCEENYHLFFKLVVKKYYEEMMVNNPEERGLF